MEHCHLHTVACHYPFSNTLAVSQAASTCLIYLSISTIHPGRGLQQPRERERTVTLKLHHKSLGSRRKRVLAGVVLRSTGMEINSMTDLGEFIVLLG